MSCYIELPAWYHLICIQHAELLDDFDRFIAAFRGHFDDPDKMTMSIHHLKVLHQGHHTVSQLYAKFVEIMQFIDISNNIKLSYFKHALADDTACQVARSAIVLTMFTEFTEFAIKVDNCLRAYEEDHYARTTDRSQHVHRITIPHSTVMPAVPPTYSLSGTASNKPVSMDVDTICISHLMPDEHRCHQTYRLCIYCGSSGHYRDTCPLLVSVRGASSTTHGGGRGSGHGGGRGQSVGGQDVGMQGGGFGGQRGGAGAGREGSGGGSGGYGRGRSRGWQRN
ncbi:hypothetical protein EWM64_g5558 [Hericium alpestre]|uniref:CCHC-type domain-containing protein n=1 Tax=Hericium alpestre TaxID=135208 RepID=A0A4Y9ZX09_9AGAM|nr:hypothetical protein EWM64_g5558 [Hericium alpestre]